MGAKQVHSSENKPHTQNRSLSHVVCLYGLMNIYELLHKGVKDNSVQQTSKTTELTDMKIIQLKIMI